MCANSIRAIHRGERAQAEELIEQARLALTEADDAMKAHPDIRYAGFFHDAAKEFAEAKITLALSFGEGIPSLDEVGVEAPAYLNGMGEAVGELRRWVLDLMRKGDLAGATQALEAMEEMYYLLTSMDYPDAMTGGLRRTTDVARALIERTRGDLTTTMMQDRLIDALSKHGVTD